MPKIEVTETQIPYADFGYVPGVAQMVQQTPYIDPMIFPRPAFTERQFKMAQWFTTRVHLSPLGEA
jgi:hypothetical protein